jgi:hypothetical protein
MLLTALTADELNRYPTYKDDFVNLNAPPFQSFLEEFLKLATTKLGENGASATVIFPALDKSLADLTDSIGPFLTAYFGIKVVDKQRIKDNALPKSNKRGVDCQYKKNNLTYDEKTMVFTLTLDGAEAVKAFTELQRAFNQPKAKAKAPPPCGAKYLYALFPEQTKSAGRQMREKYFPEECPTYSP